MEKNGDTPERAFLCQIIIKFEIKNETEKNSYLLLIKCKKETKKASKTEDFFYNFPGGKYRKNDDWQEVQNKLKNMSKLELNKEMKSFAYEKVKEELNLTPYEDFYLKRVKDGFGMTFPHKYKGDLIYTTIYTYQLFPLSFEHLFDKDNKVENNTLRFFNYLVKKRESLCNKEKSKKRELILVNEKQLRAVPPHLWQEGDDKKKLPEYNGNIYKKINGSEIQLEENGKIFISDVLPIVSYSCRVKELPFSISYIQQKLAEKNFYLPAHKFRLLEQIERASSDPLQRPIFIVGPAGCGKTTIARTLNELWSEELNDDEKTALLEDIGDFVKKYLTKDTKLIMEKNLDPTDTDKLAKEHNANDLWQNIHDFKNSGYIDEYYPKYIKNSFRNRLLSGLKDNMFADALFGSRFRMYTDAIHPVIGEFSLGYGGTVFLDEVTNIGIESQNQLLQCFSFSLDGGGFKKVSYRVRGDSDDTVSYFRLICATNSIPDKDGGFEGFRSDLLSRLSENIIDFYDAYKKITWEIILLFSNSFYINFLGKLKKTEEEEKKRMSLNEKQKEKITKINKVYISHHTAKYISRLNLKETFRNLVNLLISAFFNAIDQIEQREISDRLEIKIKNLPDIKNLFLSYTGD